MYSQLTSLEASWTGQAASAFQNVVGDCRIRQQRVEESLAAINQALASRRAAVRRRGAAERQTLFRLAVAS